MSSFFARIKSKLLRALGHGPLRLSPEDALAIAHRQCQERDWPFAKPVTIRREHNTYAILTFANMRGGNVRFSIDGNTGAVLYAGFVRH